MYLLCYLSKSCGLVACWDCYHEIAMRYGNVEAEARLDRAEAFLAGVRLSVACRAVPL